MTKAAAIKQISELAITQAETSGLLKTAGAADFYEALSITLYDTSIDRSASAARLAALIRETERHQLKFRELLRA